jgi:opacity protein-like surface antigen
MRSGISALCFVALMGCAAAEAPAPTPAAPPIPAAAPVLAATEAPPAATAGTRFDGTYAFVSSTKLDEAYFSTGSTHVRPCPDRPMGPLTVVNGRARSYGFGRSTAAGYEGTVGSQGELAMRLNPQPNTGIMSTIERNLVGSIDGNGTIKARETSYACRRDLIWQKQSK